ncbi:MAG TPA: transporter [Mycobacteriales bacterium]|nr:transporter [Mycobacteriales bacterium]
MTLERVLLTLATLAFGAGISWLMLRGWRSRQGRQADLPAPPVPPAVPGDLVAGSVSGLFVGTTSAEDWLDRIAVHGLAHRAPVELVLRTDGVWFERDGADDLFLPYSSVRTAVVGDALAGKVVGKGGLLLVDWVLGGRLLTTGFRADDHGTHRRLADAITAHLPTEPTGPFEEAS